MSSTWPRPAWCSGDPAPATICSSQASRIATPSSTAHSATLFHDEGGTMCTTATWPGAGAISSSVSTATFLAGAVTAAGGAGAGAASEVAASEVAASKVAASEVARARASAASRASCCRAVLFRGRASTICCFDFGLCCFVFALPFGIRSVRGEEETRRRASVARCVRPRAVNFGGESSGPLGANSDATPTSGGRATRPGTRTTTTTHETPGDMPSPECKEAPQAAAPRRADAPRDLATCPSGGIGAR